MYSYVYWLPCFYAESYDINAHACGDNYVDIIIFK